MNSSLAADSDMSVMMEIRRVNVAGMSSTGDDFMTSVDRSENPSAWTGGRLELRFARACLWVSRSDTC